jgi:hypothetical protein
VAESIIIHFATTDWNQLGSWLDARAVHIDHRRWNYPEPFDPLLYAYEYAEHQTEIDSGDLDRLIRLLGGYPTAALCLQLRSVHGDRSCDVAAQLAEDLLREFGGIADDTFAHDGAAYWSLSDLEAGAIRQHGRFLDCYRNHPSACRDGGCDER